MRDEPDPYSPPPALNVNFKAIGIGLLIFVMGPVVTDFTGMMPLSEPVMAVWSKLLGANVFISPTLYGDASFNDEFSLMEPLITLEVHDYNAPILGQRTINLGKVGHYESTFPEKAFWTKDGTVFYEDETGLMYDFKLHSSEIPEEFEKMNTKSNPAKGYDAFIQSRGGEGPNVLKGKYAEAPLNLGLIEISTRR